LDSPFYDSPGNYKVKINYKQISQEEFFTITGDISQPESILTEKIKPEIILLVTEKEVYTNEETVKITGIVSSLESPTVLIGIYDPFGTPAGFYFGNINKNLEFSTSFLVKAGVNFNVDGVYSIKAHYVDTDATTNFEFYEDISSSADDNSNSADDNNKKNTTNKDTSIIQDNDKKQSSNTNPNNNSIIKSPESKEEKKSNTKLPEIKSQPKSNNLSVEDVELGKLLNEINLECDRSKYSDIISYYDGMGPALYRLCKFENSLQFFSESLLKNPTDVEVLTNKGSALGKLGYYNDAILHYNKAIEINPNFLPALNNKANLLASMGNYEEAIFLYSKVLGKNPSYITAQQNLKLVLSEMPQKNSGIIQKQTPQLEENNSDVPEQSKNYEQIKLQKEKSTNFFEQVDSMLSSIVSMFGISN
jgi:tetratricopeptide (TPR) repeat protein